MIKKILPLFLVSMVCLNIHAGEDRFIDSLRDCSSYGESGTINIGGVDTKTTKEMMGWHDGKCKYRETINYGGNIVVTTCSFTKSQIQEIVSVADAYYLVQKYSNQEININSPEDLKNNPLAQVMSKYLTDSSVCQMSGL